MGVVAFVVLGVVAFVVLGVVAFVALGVVAFVALGVVAFVALGVVAAAVVFGLVVGFVVLSELSLSFVSPAVALPVTAPLFRPPEVMAGAGVDII